MKEIKWQPKVTKQLKKLDRQVKVRIFNAVQSLTHFPDVQNVKKLSNHQYGYRLRVGNYRVLFNDHETINVIGIEEAKKRDERTY
ncbi:MAG: type II toxin-antitoxin system RelE/ParE family toxin [Candidatus Sedimenticola sp. (ex Thyasira tokunagai)]